MVYRVVMYLIRHGETPSNGQGRYIGWRNEHMSQQGLSQVNRIKSRLPLFKKVYASDLGRCVETAAILSGSTGTTKKLREYHFGDFDGRTYEELKTQTGYQQWLNNMEKVTPPGGESLPQFKGRIMCFFSEILNDHSHTDEPIAVVTHGGVIRTMLHHWSKHSESMWDWSIAPGEAYKVLLEKEGDQWILSQVEHITAS